MCIGVYEADHEVPMSVSESKGSRELRLEAENERLRRLVEEAVREAKQATSIAESRYDQFDRVSGTLIQSGEFLRRVLASSGDCIKVLDLEARLQFMSSGGLAVMEIDDFEPFVGCPWSDFWTGDCGAAARTAVEDARAGRVGRFQGFCATAKGTPRWWDVQVLPLFGLDGKPEQLLSISTDITERKRAEDHQRVLMQELEHRVKNTLALVHSIANQTFRDASSLAEAQQTFTSRLFALSGAHDVLMQTSWSSASIGSVVASALGPHLGGDRKRFLVEGPEVSLSPRTSLALTMALHELCTNAAKYGSLSNESGTVLIKWDILGNEDPPRLRFVWTERDGPAVKPPSRKGFGTRLIERSLAAELENGVKLTYETTGVVCTIEAPLVAVQQAAEAARDHALEGAAHCATQYAPAGNSEARS